MKLLILIRRSRNTDTARANLVKQLKISEIQAQAILDMPLKRLASLERKKIQDEYKDLTKLIKHLEGLLQDEKKIRIVIAEELAEIKHKYAESTPYHYCR